MFASLGGIRTDPHILCPSCQETTKHIDKPIAQDLRDLAAYIGIRNTHSGDVVATISDPKTGQQYTLSAGRKIQYAAPVKLRDDVVEGARQRYFVVSTQQQRDELLHGLKSEGGPKKEVKQENLPMYFVRPPQLLPKFGGDETFRALGHLGLNFLAVHFPDVARVAELEPFKRFVLFGAQNDFVNFDFEWQNALPPNAFRFGHRVAVGVAGSEVVGALSLFGIYDVSIRFGHVAGGQRGIAVVDVDPIAAKRPMDMKISAGAQCDLTPAVTSGEDAARAVSARVVNLQRGIADRAWERDAGQLVAAVNAVRDIPGHDRARQLAQVLTPQAQRFLGIAAALARRLAQEVKQDSSKLASLFLPFLETAFEEEAHRLTPTPPSTRERSEMLLMMIRDAIVDRLLVELETGPVSPDTLRSCLEGSVVVEETFKAFSDILANMAARVDRSA